MDAIDKALARGLVILYERRLEKKGAVAKGMEVVKVESDAKEAE